MLPASGRAWSVRLWFRTLLRAAGVRLVRTNDARLAVRPAITGTLVAANHVSWLDVPAVLAVEPMRVLAKRDVRRWPVIGLLAAAGGSIFLDRDRLRTLPATVAEVAGALGRGESVMVFPEGTTRCGRVQGRFYPAMFQAAIDAGASVRPVGLRYRLADGTPTTVAAFVGADTLFASVRRIVATRGLVDRGRRRARSPTPAGPPAAAWRPPPRRSSPPATPPSNAATPDSHNVPAGCPVTRGTTEATTSPKLWPGAAYDRIVTVAFTTEDYAARMRRAADAAAAGRVRRACW